VRSEHGLAGIVLIQINTLLTSESRPVSVILVILVLARRRAQFSPGENHPCTMPSILENCEEISFTVRLEKMTNGTVTDRPRQRMF